MAYKVRILADSIGPNGVRLTTWELTYPRFVHAELMTHRLFSRNSASSRAIPTKKLMQQIRRDPAMPVWWGKNQSGMQARQELTGWREIRLQQPPSRAGAVLDGQEVVGEPPWLAPVPRDHGPHVHKGRTPMKVKLERIKNGVALRTSEVVGETGSLPEAGQRFVMVAPPLDPANGDTRLVCTSTVVAILETQEPDGTDRQVTFVTENSTYRVTVLPDAP